MHKRYLVLALASIALAFLVNIHAEAASANIVISKVQLGDSISASNEYVELKNNSQVDVDISNWCLYYASSGSLLIGSKMVCFIPVSTNTHFFVPAQKNIFIASSQLLSNYPLIKADFVFSATLSGTAGHIRLIDDKASEVDKLGWGLAAVSPETTAAVVPSAGKILNRIISADLTVLQDTDNNYNDFEVIVPDGQFNYGNIYELIDVCMNIDGIQETTPEGYIAGENLSCNLPPIDLCSNLEGLQESVPANMIIEDQGQCVVYDYCINILNIQKDVPKNYQADTNYNCYQNKVDLKLTELFPNAIGLDSDNEFIEIYNPSDIDVDLEYYYFVIGENGAKINFPVASTIGPNEYKSFYNIDIKFTLMNTSSLVRLYYFDDSQIDSSDEYVNPVAGESWSYIKDKWQYSNRPTPSAINLESKLIEEIDDTTTLTPCAEGYFRNPLTNRCKLIASNLSTLTPCKDGQYRSEITNRCRSIVSDVVSLVPCGEGEERNPATNRCRKIVAVLGANDLKPCEEGEERNPTTNRCRKIATAIMPTVGYKPIQTGIEGGQIIMNWSIAGLYIIAIIYAIWEWRREIFSGANKVLTLVKIKK